MTRTRQIALADASDNIRAIYKRLFGDRDPVAEPGTATGTPGNWWTVFAQTPDLMDHMIAGFGLFGSPNRELRPDLRELALVRTGFTGASQFVFSQHCKAARRAGLSDDKIAAVASWAVSEIYDGTERAVLAYADDLALSNGRVSDATFDAVVSALGEVATIELTYAVCSYQMHASMCRALRLEYDDVDERIVEIGAPTAGDHDVMGTISMQY